MSDYYNHSGGAEGSDMTWELVGEMYGVKTFAYSFPGHIQYSSNPVVLSKSELNEGWDNILKAEIPLNRSLSKCKSTYVRQLLCRNWFQVKNSESILAIGMFEDKRKTRVRGGTGWAVQMAINNKKPVYLFDQVTKMWYSYEYKKRVFGEYINIPILPNNFAGIGTREIMDDGIEAIGQVYDYNLKKVIDGEKENN